MVVDVADVGHGTDDSLCQPNQPGCLSPPHHHTASQWNLLYGLVLCVSLTIVYSLHLFLHPHISYPFLAFRCIPATLKDMTGRL